MKAENYINEFIDREKQTEHNPFLITRIMSEIESSTIEMVYPKILFWQKMAIVFSLVIVVAGGVTVAKSFSQNAPAYAALNVNDSEIENLTFYNLGNNE